jgi:PA-IL-like protein
MPKWGRALIAVAAISTALVSGGMAWAGTMHPSGKAAVAAQQTVTVTIPARRSTWTDTGVLLQEHHALKITATGIVQYALDRRVSPSGLPLVNFDCANISNSSFVFVASQLRCWSLIGKIDNHHPFQANSVNVADSTAGELWLMMNDTKGTFFDNSGHWTVTITTSP